MSAAKQDDDETVGRAVFSSFSAGDSESLKIIARSFAVFALRLAPRKFKNDADRIPFLKGLGLSNSEIAQLLQTTRNTVAVRLSVEGKSKKKKKKGRRPRAKH
jgi:hypothetical protein